jgi:hypothetical protein
MARGSAIISGTVSDAAGNPIAGARVLLVGGPVALPDIAALTNEEGEFMISVPVAGAYRIQCVADEYRPAEVDAVVEAGTNPKLDIRVT